MKFIVAVHPGITAPLMLAQQAATFDQFSEGRLIINIVPVTAIKCRPTASSWRTMSAMDLPTNTGLRSNNS